MSPIPRRTAQRAMRGGLRRTTGRRAAAAAQVSQQNDDRADEPGAVLRRELVLVVAVHATEPPQGWSPGPLVRRWRAGRPDEIDSSAASRTAHAHPALAPLLWGDGVRWHQELGETEPSSAGLRVEAVELVCLSRRALDALDAMETVAPANGVVLIHGRMPSEVAPRRLADVLRNCIDLDPVHAGGAHRAWVEELLPPGCRIAVTEREAVQLILVTSADDLPRLPGGPGPTELDTADQWLWHLYRASTLPGGARALEELQRLKLPAYRQLRSVLGARGLVTVGTTPDVPRSDGREPFYHGSSFHQRTVYADAIALARLQQIQLDAFGAEVARIGEREPRRGRVARLERDLLVFRRGYWAAGFGRNEAVDNMVRVWQRETGQPQSLQGLMEDLAELSRQVQAAGTETTNAILGLLAAVGLPLTAGLAVWSGLPAAGTASLWWAAGAIGVIVTGLVLAFPGLRRLCVTLFRSGVPGTRRPRRHGNSS